MGKNFVVHLISKKYKVVVYNRSPEPIQELAEKGAIPAYTLKDMAKQLPKRKIIFVMVTAGKPVDLILSKLTRYLAIGDIIIDAGNSFYLDSIKRANKLKAKGIKLLDVGVSGGLEGAGNGACFMAGGDKKSFNKIEKILKDVSVKGGYGYFGESGSGHFAKMVHNGIEYGMMQSIAEGFEVIERSKFRIDKEKLARVYSNGSVIRGWLMELLAKSYSKDKNLRKYSGAVGMSGEGEWTLKTAKKIKVPVPAIEASVNMRKKSIRQKRYQGKVVQALRYEFGGHSEPR